MWGGRISLRLWRNSPLSDLTPAKISERKLAHSPFFVHSAAFAPHSSPFFFGWFTPFHRYRDLKLLSLSSGTSQFANGKETLCHAVPSGEKPRTRPERCRKKRPESFRPSCILTILEKTHQGEIEKNSSLTSLPTLFPKASLSTIFTLHFSFVPETGGTTQSKLPSSDGSSPISMGFHVLPLLRV